MKTLLYCDMDGVVADFEGKIEELQPGILQHPNRSVVIDELCAANYRIFNELEPIKDSVQSVKELSKYYEIYFLSVPMWHVPHSFMDKRLWIEKHFGHEFEKRLILTHRKDLNIGQYLIDDRLVHGVEDFQGLHIHFGSETFPHWGVVKEFLLTQHYQKTK